MSRIGCLAVLAKALLVQGDLCCIWLTLLRLLLLFLLQHLQRFLLEFFRSVLLPIWFLHLLLASAWVHLRGFYEALIEFQSDWCCACCLCGKPIFVNN